MEGVWRSDVDKTLESMRGTGKVNDKQRKLFEGDFFGRLSIEITCRKVIVDFNGNRDEFEYKTIIRDGDTVRIEYVNPEAHKGPIRPLILEEGGECYHVQLEELQFNEYFCRVKDLKDQGAGLDS